MPKLRVFIAEQQDDAACYNIMARTKKEMVSMMRTQGHVTFTRAALVELKYDSAFDLADMMTNEGGGKGIGYPFKILREYTKPLCSNHSPEDEAEQWQKPSVA